MSRAQKSSTPPLEDHLPLNPKVFMVLTSLAEGRAHGYEIKKRAEARAEGLVKLDAGSLYRRLATLEEQGLVREADERPEPEEDDSRRRYYELTDLGRQILAAEARRVAGLVRIAQGAQLHPSPEEAL